MAETASHYLGGLRMDILEYTNKWEKYARALSIAYRSAYNSQSTILAAVKKAIDERKKKEMEMLTFTLSLLTMGVAGTVTNRFVKKFTDRAKSAADVGELAAKIASDSLILDWTGDTMKALSRRAADKAVHDPLLDKLGLKSPSSNGNGFAPAGMAPGEYGDRLSAGILERANLLSDFARAFYDHFASTLSPEAARDAQRALRRSPFFTDVPTRIPEDALTRRAKQALWIAWAKMRDEPYWRRAGHHLNPEVWEFAPVRKELASLGVPDAQIALKHPMDFGPGSRMGLMRVPQGGLNMAGLISWAKGPGASNLLFQGLETNAKGLAAARHYLQYAMPMPI